MTIKDFFEGKGNFAIHCDTEEKAKKLLKEFDKAGYHWRTGERYIAYTNWGRHKEKTCYSDDGCFGRVGYFKICGYTIIEFDEIEDVQEVKHGKWVKGKTDREYCSICHEVRPYYFKETLVNRYAEQKKLSLINWECPYCPNCGTKMDEKEEEIV